MSFQELLVYVNNNCFRYIYLIFVLLSDVSFCFLFQLISFFLQMDEVNDQQFRRFVIFVGLFLLIICFSSVRASLADFDKRLRDLALDPTPYRMVGEFEHNNGTLLSPQGQDQRWDDFSTYFIKFQADLNRRRINRYVVYSTTNSGLANKINGLLSSLLIAMVSERGLQRKSNLFFHECCS